jgi:hypothetical protein
MTATTQTRATNRARTDVGACGAGPAHGFPIAVCRTGL